MSETRIGIVGDGQLARMLIDPLDLSQTPVTAMGPNPEGPAVQVGASHIASQDYDDYNNTLLLGRSSDLITVELDGVNTHALAELQAQGREVHPFPEDIAWIHDKKGQKAFLKSAGLPVPHFVDIPQTGKKNFIHDVWKEVGPGILKKRFGGLDGRGNFVIESEEDIERIFENVKGLLDMPVYYEELVPFTNELAVVTIRDREGNISSYDAVETVHKNNICHEVYAPMPGSEDVKVRAEALGIQVAGLMKGAGVFTTEMFLTEDGEILINEIAPRVHNSGHHTKESCVTSQFENHMRAIQGQEIGSTEMKVEHAVMVNILGETKSDEVPQGGRREEDGVVIYMYGKTPNIDRKIGDIIAVGNAVGEPLQRARDARSQIPL